MPTLDNIHKIDRPFWARPGFVSFAPKDDDLGGGKGDEDDEDDDPDDEDDEPDDLADLSDDELRDELRKTRESLSKASGSSKTKRDRIKALRAELADAKKPKPAKKDGDEDDDKPDLDSVRAAARAEARAEADARIVKAEARGALASAGVAKERVARAVGLLDLKSIDVDDEGEIDGLDDAIDALKKDWPELFPAERKRRASIAGDDDRDGTAGRRGKGKPSTDELQAAALLGRSVRR